ncbi:hypothetical protein L486_03416 [Kwoniella mangroviensis CBS 10435]|uniref:Rhamnolipids biosynthesis 3-oxoacyl-[acyl-carrier-protein] reductase n=1 Tax=Kwoniella mangroviensis CBS 10435 TaxID=1331196 RepID=A0A1B9ITT2_9TREE|nr:uncharacterized protein I203_02100 [Kwoniella mangroviensis CBS 8507]OCF58923.1 hypothetical protein L486_03416 [Kwoniella mangroviensis CBS 10435]OCF68714.1 hypothetical protein I203_02100 [Kwoniella mangroviensis CBS 8507]OCF76823.1 hypothetical protein I204_02529 [Kwoniella mangroviensis CBS 8886]
MSSISTAFKVEDIFGVKGKIVVVTGGGTGLGKAITAGFANNGAKVYITGRRKEVLGSTAKEIGGDIVAIQGDVSTKEGCKAIADAIKAKESKIDVLINCAGVMRGWKSSISNHDDPDQVADLLWEGHDDDDFNYSNSINVNGVYFITAALVPLLRQSDFPSVTVIASIAGLANQRAMGTVSYGVTKVTIHLGKLLAGRLHPMKIRVNTICPGIFPSEMTGKSETGEGHEYNLAEGASKAAKRSTAGRPGLPEEIVGPVLLLSSRAGGYIDGALLTVDGGRLMGAGINDGLRLAEDTYI